jgi:hypothetical protein
VGHQKEKPEDGQGQGLEGDKEFFLGKAGLELADGDGDGTCQEN